MKSLDSGGVFIGPDHWRKPLSASGPGWYYRCIGGLQICVTGGDNKTRTVEIPAKEILKYADELRKAKKKGSSHS